MEGVGTMNPTHEPDNNAAQPRAFGENFLVELFTDKDRFRAWIASATGTAAQSTSDACRFCGRPGCYPVCEVSANGVQNCGLVPCRDEADRLGGDELPSTAPVDLVTETDDETTARVLRDAAAYLERHGWIQGAYYDATSGSFTPAACLVGAIGMVCYGGPVDAPAQQFDDPGFLDFEAAVLHLDRYLLAEDGSESYEFNDAKGRRVEDVTRVLRDAAGRPAEELIDALRAIDQQNVDTAALAQAVIPGGTWNDPVLSEDQDGELTNFVDCQFCGAPGGYPYCQGSFNGQMSCADVVAADDAELAARGGDARSVCPECGSRDRQIRKALEDDYCEHIWHDGGLQGGDAR
jgi:hypothetical protein